MNRLFSNPAAFRDFLDREIGALDRLVEEVWERNREGKPRKKPAASVKQDREAMAAQA
jgi:hypothetical protein